MQLQDLKKIWQDDPRRGLAKAITLVESSLTQHFEIASQFIEENFKKTGRSIRIGISGPPGVGKSSYIEKFGLSLLKSGHRVAVLAVDPSSPVSGGSILGDKTRMSELSVHPSCYIRPSPNLGGSGGIANRTRDAIFLCEIAGFDYVLVETVGVGQSEFAVQNICDLFLLLHQPGSGDELQGVKKGIMELADLILVTKMDHELKNASVSAKAEIEGSLSLSLTGSSRAKPVIALSTITEEGLFETFEAIQSCIKQAKESGSFETRRNLQIKQWLQVEIDNFILSKVHNHSNYEELTTKEAHLVQIGTASIYSSVKKIASTILRSI